MVSLTNLEQGKKYMLTIFDVAGRLIATQAVNASSTEQTTILLQEKGLKPGYYTLGLNDENGRLLITLPIILLNN